MIRRSDPYRALLRRLPSLVTLSIMAGVVLSLAIVLGAS